MCTDEWWWETVHYDSYEWRPREVRETKAASMHIDCTKRKDKIYLKERINSVCYSENLQVLYEAEKKLYMYVSNIIPCI